MNRVHSFIGSVALTLSLSFSAAADEHRERDFQITAKNFTAGALPEVTPQAVPIFCRRDFNWNSNPAEPTPELLERIDTLGFSGGEESTIAFLLMNNQERQAYLEPLGKFQKGVHNAMAREYDSADNKIQYLQKTMNRNHHWGTKRFGEIAAECRKRVPGL